MLGNHVKKHLVAHVRNLDVQGPAVFNIRLPGHVSVTCYVLKQKIVAQLQDRDCYCYCFLFLNLPKTRRVAEEVLALAVLFAVHLYVPSMPFVVFTNSRNDPSLVSL